MAMSLSQPFSKIYHVESLDIAGGTIQLSSIRSSQISGFNPVQAPACIYLIKLMRRISFLAHTSQSVLLTDPNISMRRKPTPSHNHPVDDWLEDGLSWFSAQWALVFYFSFGFTITVLSPEPGLSHSVS